MKLGPGKQLNMFPSFLGGTRNADIAWEVLGAQTLNPKPSTLTPKKEGLIRPALRGYQQSFRQRPFMCVNRQGVKSVSLGFRTLQSCWAIFEPGAAVLALESGNPES